MRAQILLCVALLSGSSATAEEPGIFDLVTRQVAQHGRSIHEARAARAEARLSADCRDIRARLDLALARAHLGEVGPARIGAGTPEPISAGSPEPDLIRMVCHAEAQDFGSAAIMASRLLSRDPDDFGPAGDWVVRMYAWRAEPSLLAVNFLGTPHAEWKWLVDGAGASYESSFARFKALLTLYPDFADGFLVLGDEFCRR